jgi:L-asparaginase II
LLKAGIPVVIREESYTSRASLLDLDVIPTYKKGDATNYTFFQEREYAVVCIKHTGKNHHPRIESVNHQKIFYRKIE